MENSPLSHKYIQEDKFLNALADAYRLQEAIINATDLAIISVNPEGIITSFNVAAERLLGFTAEDMIGILMTQRMMESPTPPKVFRDFWTGAYQAFND